MCRKKINTPCSHNLAPCNSCPHSNNIYIRTMLWVLPIGGWFKSCHFVTVASLELMANANRRRRYIQDFMMENEISLSESSMVSTFRSVVYLH